jgi:aminomethyltransferase
MPVPSPLHSRTAALCESQEWRDWSGYLAAATYEPGYEREYFAIRNAAALIDVSPLFKYEIYGPQAAELVNRIFTRDLQRCAVGQVMYTPWCDDDGKVIDDGTVARLAAERFRITAADPSLVWFQDCGYRMEAEVEDVSERLAAIAIQGPNAREILKRVLTGIDLDGLKYYRLAHGLSGERPVTVTRTGYTGDLGYELWVAPEDAEVLWDRLVVAGRGYGLLPAGMAALDLARIEAGLLLIEVDYKSSRKALIPAHNSSPFELGLGWAVDLEKPGFIGRQALLVERQRGPQWGFAGLEADWEALERQFARAGLPPQVAGRASRLAVPVYLGRRQIGQATSQAFSPVLKKYLALATLDSQHLEPGMAVEIEITVEYVRLRVGAKVVKLPFFNPARKRG